MLVQDLYNLSHLLKWNIQGGGQQIIEHFYLTFANGLASDIV